MKKLIVILVFFIASSAFAQNIKPMDNAWGVKATFGKVVNYRMKYGSKSDDDYSFYGIGLTKRLNLTDSGRLGLQLDFLLAKNNFHRKDTIIGFFSPYVDYGIGIGQSDNHYHLDYKMDRYSVSVPVAVVYKLRSKYKPTILFGIKPSWFFATIENSILVEKSTGVTTPNKLAYRGMPVLEVTDVSLFTGFGADFRMGSYIFNVSAHLQWAVYNSSPYIHLTENSTEWVGDMYASINLAILRSRQKAKR